MSRLAVILLLFLGTAEAGGQIKADEEVIFFPTYGALDVEAAAWLIEIHGWIYEPEADAVLRVLNLDRYRGVVGARRDQPDDPVFPRRARLFLVDNERNKWVEVRCGSVRHTVGPSGADGHFRGRLRLPIGELDKMGPPDVTADGRLRFVAATAPDDPRVFAGTIHLLGPTGVSVVSDIDDTIKVTQVADKAALLANTFLREFEAVPGMAKLYARWAEAGATFHYVSESPWQLYGPLSDFLRVSGFPEGTFHLKRFRWQDGSAATRLTWGPQTRSIAFGVPASSDSNKRRAIEAILAAFPRRQFILVGDSGERDPELYAALARAWPERIRFVLIRNVSGEAADGPRFERAFSGVPADRWTIFEEVEELPDRVSEICHPERNGE